MSFTNCITSVLGGVYSDRTLKLAQGHCGLLLQAKFMPLKLNLETAAERSAVTIAFIISREWTAVDSQDYSSS